MAYHIEGYTALYMCGWYLYDVDVMRLIDYSKKCICGLNYLFRDNIITCRALIIQ